MARKSLNKANLVDLGAEALAELLLEAVQGDAARQRRVRMALVAEQGAPDVAVDLRKRFASIRRARGFLLSKAQSALARELAGVIATIEASVAPEAPETAFDLLWALLQLAPDIHARTDDSNGLIGDVMDGTMQAIARLSGTLARDPGDLAEMVFEALSDNGFGQFDGAIPALADALGDAGLDRLQRLAETARAAPPSAADLASCDFVSDPDRRADMARGRRDRTAGMILQDVADLRGDVDAWLARYTAEQLTFHTIAPDAAQRLLAAGRAQEALRLIENALPDDGDAVSWLDTPDLDAAHFACLDALGREDDLRRALWARFERCLCPDALRGYLKRLPDFEDVEAEDRARAVALGFSPIETALAFCLSWPDHALAAKLILARCDEIDGDAYEILTPAADALSHERPLASVLLWRAMIRFALDRARAKRYRHAARHLMSCAAVEATIADHAGHPDHAAFLRSLQDRHGRKFAFWERVNDMGGAE